MMAELVGMFVKTPNEQIDKYLIGNLSLTNAYRSLLKVTDPDSWRFNENH
jgi:hypothetical protein